MVHNQSICYNSRTINTPRDYLMPDNRIAKALSPEELLSKTTLTIEEMSLTLGIGRNSAYEAVKRGDIPSIRIGRRILVPTKALDNLLASNAGKPQGSES